MSNIEKHYASQNGNDAPKSSEASIRRVNQKAQRGFRQEEMRLLNGMLFRRSPSSGTRKCRAPLQPTESLPYYSQGSTYLQGQLGALHEKLATRRLL
jgi:hypothetical protein